MAVDELAPAPAEAPRPPRYGPLALLRNSWRQLTSMRTALILLFLLAVAAIPGSVLPQRDVNVEDVRAYLAAHPDAGPILDRLWAFDVFGSPWFAAIYLLLFTSLAGCILPRLAEHWRALRSVPPDAPKNLARLPQHAGGQQRDGDPAQVAEAVRAMLRGRRWRTVAREQGDGGWTVSAEKGYLKETGNLVFHSALIAVLIGVAVGSWWGWHGNRLLVVGPDRAFCNSIQQYDEYGFGARVDGADLPPFCLELTDFEATFQPTGQPKSYLATVTVTGDGAQRSAGFSVNNPLRLGGANVYLLGHGYAPILRYTDKYGTAQTVIPPFLPTDGMLTSEGVAVFADANVNPATGARDPKQQVAFEGLYLPTVPDQPPLVRSAYPAERSPGIMLWFYRGDLGMDAGLPGSVYKLNQAQVTAGRLTQVTATPKLLRVGEAWTLDDGTKVEFLGTRKWITLSVRHDPGEYVVLVSAMLLVGGLMLSLSGRRRRVWFRITPGTTPGSSMVEAGGLPRSEQPGFAAEFEGLRKSLLRDRKDTD